MNVELALTSVHPLHSHPVRGLDPGHLNNANENGMSRMYANGFICSKAGLGTKKAFQTSPL